MKISTISCLLAMLLIVASVQAQDFVKPDSSTKVKRHRFSALGLARNDDQVDSKLSLPSPQAQNAADDVQEVWMRRYASWLVAPSEGASAMTSDTYGNVYVTGVSSSTSGGYQDTDYATVKYIASGTLEWVTHYKCPGNSYDVARAVAADVSGNVYVTGNSGVYPESDYATVKYNSAGTEKWVARYLGLGDYSVDYALALAVDAAGNVYVTGVSGGDYATIKYISAGTEQWVARYNAPGNSYDVAHALAVDDSGNVYVTGNGGTIKYNSAGSLEWVANRSGSALAIDAAGNVYVTGYCVGSGTGFDYATIKYTSAGTEQWVARYNGPGNYDDYANALAVDPAGNVYVTGGSGGDYATVKYDFAGTEHWVARYNGPGNSSDQATALVVGPAGSIYVTGYSSGAGASFDYATIKYNSAGAEQLIFRYNGPGNHNDYANALAVDPAGNVYVTGSSGTIKYNFTRTE